MKTPPTLKKGDTVAIAATARKISKEIIEFIVSTERLTSLLINNKNVITNFVNTLNHQ